MSYWSRTPQAGGTFRYHWIGYLVEPTFIDHGRINQVERNWNVFTPDGSTLAREVRTLREAKQIVYDHATRREVVA